MGEGRAIVSTPRFSFRETKIDGPRRCSVASTRCSTISHSFLDTLRAKGHATPSFDHVFFFPFRFDRCLAPAWALTLTAALSTRNVCTEEVWVSMEVADVCEDGGVS